MHAHMPTHKCAAGIDEIAEPDASAAVYPALFLSFFPEVIIFLDVSIYFLIRRYGI